MSLAKELPLQEFLPVSITRRKLLMILIATCEEMYDDLHGTSYVEDDLLLLDSFQRAGVPAQAAVWNRPFQWEDAKMLVLRSTWDYYRDRTAFLAWAEELEQAGVIL